MVRLQLPQAGFPFLILKLLLSVMYARLKIIKHPRPEDAHKYDHS